MGEAVTYVGAADEPHCTPMNRAEGFSDITVNGIPVSCQGHNNTPHLRPPNRPPCPGHSAAIATGSSTVTCHGVGIGRVGDDISGCTAVAQGSPDVSAG